MATGTDLKLGVNHDVTLEQARNGINVLVDMMNKHNSNNLLQGSKPIFLQVDFIKIPQVEKKVIRIPLPHSLLMETSDVCLFVPDLIRGRNVNHEMTITHYKKLLEKRGISNEISQIIPCRQFRVEYSTYEAKRKLCNMFDIFLIHNKISEFLIPKLGSQFHKDRKWPIPIRMKRKNLKDEITSKLKKTSMWINDFGFTKTIQVGHSEMPIDHIAENIVFLLNTIGYYAPFWTWKNVRSLHVKGERTPAIPLYMSLAVPNDVPTPSKPVKKKLPPVTDELSTIGKKVTVFPNGRIRIN